MKQPGNMCMVYNTIAANVGKRVKVKSNLGRNRYDIAEGVITKIYPSIFIIELDKDMPEASKRISYTYSDVLTKEIELVLC